MSYFKGLYPILIKIFNLLKVLSTLIDGDAAKSNITLNSSCRRLLKGKELFSKHTIESEIADFHIFNFFEVRHFHSGKEQSEIFH